MDQPPDFLRLEVRLETTQECYRPAGGGRRGEIVAWVCSLLMVGLVALLMSRQGKVSALVMVLLVFFSGAAALVSFGNWMERHTQIVLDAAGVKYSSPLRRTAMAWGTVESLWLLPLGRGWRTVVRSRDGLFHFRTPPPVSSIPSGGLTIGFPRGERLTGLIRSLGRLTDLNRNGEAWVCTRPTGRRMDAEPGLGPLDHS
jgi:hypothetical protein